MSGNQKQAVQRFHSSLWSNKRVVDRTIQALNWQQAEFRRAHQNDTDAQLLAYVRQAAEAFGVTPCAAEIIGGPYIAGRFGGWENVVAALGLDPPHALPPLTRRRIYKREFKRQALLFKRECEYLKGLRTAPEGEPQKIEKGAKDHAEPCLD